jgi:hypothetical protein
MWQRSRIGKKGTERGQNLCALRQFLLGKFCQGFNEQGE